jgi:hypothetical protein
MKHHFIHPSHCPFIHSFTPSVLSWSIYFDGAEKTMEYKRGYILYIKVTISVCLLLPSFIYYLFEVTFFYLIYLSYFLLNNFCMCSNASHHMYVRSCFKYLLAGGGQHGWGGASTGGGGTGGEGPTSALCTGFTLVTYST